jgi:hypothetical protein
MDEKKLYLIDCSAPFFSRLPEGETVNWSKAPLSGLEEGGRIRGSTFKNVRREMELYVSRVSGMGYNGLTLDDLAHLALLRGYPDKTADKIVRYRRHYEDILSIARSFGMSVFVNTDICFTNQTILGRLTDGEPVESVMEEAVLSLFTRFPEVSGVVFRAGESDGVDTKSEFRSRILLETPVQANRFLRKLLPLFERLGKTLIFRTWTVGAYPLGDLIWNPSTWKKVFRNISSTALVISMKPGEGDFFRYLELNPIFFLPGPARILEIQARREYEGFGEFPSYIGKEIQAWSNELSGLTYFRGVSVWCQTGGWSRFRNLTFLRDSSFWNELNAAVAVAVFRYGRSHSKAACHYWGGSGKKDFLEFLRLSGEVVEKYLYVPAFAKKRWYFRSVRVPPLLDVLWDRVTITDGIARVYRALSGKHGGKEYNTGGMKKRLARMELLADRLRLPYRGEFHRDTLRVLTLARKLVFRKGDIADANKLARIAAAYRRKHPDGFRFRVNLTVGMAHGAAETAIRLAVRKKPEYRLLDRLIFHPWLLFFWRVLARLLKRQLPPAADRVAMPLEKLLR